MGNFREYLDRANETAKQAFGEYLGCKKKYEQAKERLNNTPMGVTLREQADFSRVKADYNECSDDFRIAKKNFAGYVEVFKEIKAELADAVEKRYTVNPVDVDTATLALLNSGILKTADYEKLMDDAIKERNITMIRLIADATEKATAEYKGREMSPEALRMRAVVTRGKALNGQNYLERFDTLSDLFRRCTENDYMITKWDDFVSEIKFDF